MRRDIASNFAEDVAGHEMTVLFDNGTRRHIRFGRPGTNFARFDLVTWPGHLCYTGDMGTYVFARIDDMFEFFRRDWPNLDYWAEKVIGEDRDGVRHRRAFTGRFEWCCHALCWAIAKYDAAKAGDTKQVVGNAVSEARPEELR